MSFDDGGWQDAEVIAVLHRNGVCGTFYIPSCILLESVYAGARLSEIKDMYLHNGVEIGAHTRSHLRLSHMTEHELLEEIGGGRNDLAQCFGVPADSIRCFAYPYGDFDNLAAHIVAACGFIMGRTCKRGNPALVSKGQKGSMLAITCILRPQNSDWRGMLEEAIKGRHDIHLISHAWELEKFKAMDSLESVIVRLKTEGYQFCTNSEFTNP